MKVLFTTQETNSNKHELMPLGYPFTTYEVEDDYPEAELIGQGYSVLTLEEFNTYKNSFDLSDYLAAIGQSEDDIILERLKAIEDICDDMIAKMKVDMVKKKIASPINGQVTIYLHNLMHYLEVQAIDEAYNEIDTLINSGVPSDLEPFVTEQILVDFKSELASRIAAL